MNKGIVKYFTAGTKKYKLVYYKGNYQGSHTAMSLHIYLLGEEIPCVVCYRSIVKTAYELRCTIGRKTFRTNSMKEFKIEAIKYLTNS